MSPKTGSSNGVVVLDQRWLQWVNKPLPALKAGNPAEKLWNFDNPAAANMFKTATDTLGLSGLTMYRTRHSGADIDRVGGGKDEVSGKRSLSRARSETSWKHSRNVPRYC